MKDRKQAILVWTAALLPLVMVALSWTSLPEQVPTNWSFSGEINSWGARWVMWPLALINPLLIVLMQGFPQLDPKKENYQKFAGSYRTFQLAFALFMDAVQGAMLIETLRPGTIHIEVVIQMLAAVLMMVVGNMMPKFRQTWFCGFKTPWTLSSERVWAKTHRLGGRLYFAAGLVVLAGAFLPPFWSFAVLLTAAVTAGLVPTVMSYVWFRQEQV